MGTPGWLPYVLDEQRACREDAVVFDQTSFSKFVASKVATRSAVLQRLCANEIDVAIGRMVYTAMLNARGGLRERSHHRADRRRRVLHHHRLGANDATSHGSSARYDADEHAALVDVTNAHSVISVMGAQAEALLNRVSPDDLSKTGMPFSHDEDDRQSATRAFAPRAMSYVGGPGYELYVSTDQCVTLYEALWSVGGELGLRDAGY